MNFVFNIYVLFYFTYKIPQKWVHVIKMFKFLKANHYFFYWSLFWSFGWSLSYYFFSPWLFWFAYSKLNLIANCYNYYSVCSLWPCCCWLCPCWLAGCWACCCGMLSWRLILIAYASSGSSTYIPPILPPPPLIKISVPNNFSLR